MKLATVGTSFITDNFIQAALEEGSFELTTVFSRTPEKAQALADKYHIPKTQSDWEALLKDPQIDVVYIATPNDTHFALAKSVLQAKKHVILEKPFVSNSKELKAILKVAQDNDRFVFDAIIPMHLPNFAILKQAIHQVGRLRLCNLSMVQRSSRYNALCANQEPAIFSLAHSGGTLMDLGVYPISIMIGLFGSPMKVTYLCNKYSNGIDVSGVLTFKYPDFIAVATIAKDSAGLNFITLNGDEAYIQSDKAPSMVHSVTLVDKNKSTELGLQQDALLMKYEIKDFYDVILKHDLESYQTWMALTLKVFEVLDDCRRQSLLIFPADAEV